MRARFVAGNKAHCRPSPQAVTTAEQSWNCFTDVLLQDLLIICMAELLPAPLLQFVLEENESIDLTLERTPLYYASALLRGWVCRRCRNWNRCDVTGDGRCCHFDNWNTIMSWVRYRRTERNLTQKQYPVTYWTMICLVTVLPRTLNESVFVILVPRTLLRLPTWMIVVELQILGTVEVERWAAISKWQWWLELIQLKLNKFQTRTADVCTSAFEEHIEDGDVNTCVYSTSLASDFKFDVCTTWSAFE